MRCAAPSALRASYSRCGTYFHICCTRETDSVCDSKTITDSNCVSQVLSWAG